MFLHVPGAAAATRDAHFVHHSYRGLVVPATGAWFGADDTVAHFSGSGSIENILQHNLAIHNRHWSHGASVTNIVAGVKADVAAGAIPMLSFGGQGYKSNTLAGIAAGKEDSYWSGLATQLGAVGVPIIFRPWMEMNGAHNAYSNNPAAYKAAWRHLYALMNLKAQLIWVFCPQLMPNTWKNYWPGNPYVTWFGLDLYRHTPSAAEPFFVFAHNHLKPFIIAEAGFQQGKVVKDPQTGITYDKDGSVTGRSLIHFTEHDLAVHHPNVIAYVHWEGVGPVGNDLVTTSTASTDQYRAWVTDPYFGGGGSPPPPPPPPPAAIKHIVMIVEENHNATQATAGMPYMVSLGAQGAHDYTSYSAITHPSLPNYFALTAGATLVSKDCGSGISGCTQSADNIFHQTDVAGVGWAQLSQSMQGNCRPTNSLPYVVHHAVAPFFTDLTDCAQFDVPLNPSAVPPITAGFTFITPDKNNDAHDGSLAQADAFLKQVVPQVVADDTLVEIVFDEGSNGDNHVSLVLLNPAVAGKVLTGNYNHYSLLRLNEELLGLPLLQAAANAPDMRAELGL